MSNQQQSGDRYRPDPKRVHDALVEILDVLDVPHPRNHVSLDGEWLTVSVVAMDWLLAAAVEHGRAHPDDGEDPLGIVTGTTLDDLEDES